MDAAVVAEDHRSGAIETVEHGGNSLRERLPDLLHVVDRMTIE